MDLSDAPDEARFRQDLRAWLQKSLPELPWPEPADLVEKAPFWRRWQAMLFEAGYAGLTWPREYGGQGLDERMRVIFGEECDLAGAPERLNIIGEDFAGPTIAHFGTDRQKDRYLRPILTGEEIWCQLFSEPDSGSDLASLRTNTTKAVDDLVAEIRLLTDDAGHPLGADPHVRQRVADLWARALVHHTISQRVISGAVAAGPPGPVASIGKLYFCPLVEDLADFRLSLEPLAGQFGLDDTSQEAARARRWLRLANQARGTAIAGGSTFIQRNIVAERILGLPSG